MNEAAAHSPLSLYKSAWEMTDDERREQARELAYSLWGRPPLAHLRTTIVLPEPDIEAWWTPFEGMDGFPKEKRADLWYEFMQAREVQQAEHEEARARLNE